MNQKQKVSQFDYQVFALSILFGLIFIIIDVNIDTHFFGERNVFDQLFRPSAYEIYFRGTIFLTYVVFGLTVSIIVSKLKFQERQLSEMNTELVLKNNELSIQTKIAQSATENVKREIARTRDEMQKKEKYLSHIEQVNRFMIDREYKMVELKKEINLLLKELGKQPRYHVKVESF